MTKRVAIDRMLAWYEPTHSRFETYARYTEDFIKDILRNELVEVHAVTARAKSPSSLRHKLFTNHYKKPSKEITDLIGVRVIVYYERDVDVAAEALRRYLVINKRESVDKRADLEADVFGYRSFHLIAKIVSRGISFRSFPVDVRGRWFEVQIRTVLEHAWAEIEHEVVYKSGMRFPARVEREFAAAAGGLEILDREFQRLRAQYYIRVHRALQRISSGIGLSQKLDVSRMLAALEFVFPKGQSFRQSRRTRQPFPAHIEAQALPYLLRGRVSTPKALMRTLRSKRLRALLDDYRRTLTPKGTFPSHLAILAFTVGLVQPRALNAIFSELLADENFLRMALKYRLLGS